MIYLNAFCPSWCQPLYVNDTLVTENFLHKNTSDYELEEEIPNGYYFVLGDNRPDSVDSRLIGLIKKEEIIGKTNLVIFPFNHFGIKK